LRIVAKVLAQAVDLFARQNVTNEDLRAVKEARSDSAISWSDAETELSAG
jgi:hypothetical protein